ncbi:SH3 domain-containing protein [Nostoc sp. XA010]|uniref:SH3 domain-containing protein n=1 Tax=Nostoc sp. XA010 TaxID=2780407 RepID=UPI001E52CA75|nr:SH3 domain-containing protein [Nostoc sp. XA010]MCC5660220.1 SH3 domain-containing protein [Nostoc sp. XA010]
MNQLSGIGEGIFKLCKTYWLWVNQIVDNHTVSKNKLNEMVRKGRFKTLEEAERSAKHKIKVALITAPVILLVVMIFGLLPKSENKSAVVQNIKDSTPAQINEPESHNQAEQTMPLPELSKTNIEASVKKTGSDFSYETSGRVLESDKAIVVTYISSSKCGEGAFVFKQERQTTFDLSSQTWTDKVRELSNCLGTPHQEWMDFSKEDPPSRFSIESSGNTTLIRADLQDYDGSLIMKDTLVVKYAKPRSEPTISQAVDKPSSSTRIVQASDGYANLRSYPSTEVAVLVKVPNGTSVTILSKQANTAGQLWYKVQVDGQIGWLYSDLLK